MDSVSRSSSSTDLTEARNELPRTTQVAPPPPPAGGGHLAPVFRLQNSNSPSSESQGTLERVATDWMLGRLSVNELAVDSPGKQADISEEPGRPSEEITPGADVPSREQLVRHFRAAQQVPASRSHISAEQLLASGSMGGESFGRLSESTDEATRQKAQLIVSAVEALAVAHTQMATLTEEEKGLALIFAAARGYLTVVEMLLREGVNTNAQDANGCTALEAAAMHNHAAVVQYLMRQNPEVRVRPSGGNRSDYQNVGAESTMTTTATTGTAFTTTTATTGTTIVTTTADTTQRDFALRNVLAYNIGHSLREANRPESFWVGQSQTQLPEKTRQTD